MILSKMTIQVCVLYINDKKQQQQSKNKTKQNKTKQNKK